MWEINLHNLAPLTHFIFIKVKFKWTKIEQDAFDDIKRVVDRDTLLASTNFNE